MDKRKKVKTGQGQRSGHRHNYARGQSSSNQMIFYVLIVGVLFYLSIDSRLSNRSKIANLFDSFEGSWADNNDLFAAEKYFTDTLHGPESLANYKGNLYTGTSRGQIFRIEGDKLAPVIQLGGDSCSGQHNSKACGRPLGVRVTSSGDLYTVDAFNGLVKVTNIDGTQSGQSESKLLYNISLPVDGNSSKFLDDLVIDESSPEGKVIYMTDASTLWTLNDCVAAVVDMDDSGRILRYSESTGSVDVVLSGIAFPNGIELTDSKDALLIAEFTQRRVLKYYLTGPSKGTTEVLINLPGEPDNIRRSARSDEETYWIAVFSPRTKENPIRIDYLTERPLLRKVLITVYQLYGTLLQMIGRTLDSQSLKDRGRLASSLWSLGSTALQIDLWPLKLLPMAK